MRGLAGKRILISGGTSGIGLATAQRFLEEGSHVFVGGLDSSEVDKTVADLAPLGKISGIPVDISREDDVTRLVDTAVNTLGGLDVLINNAGIAWREPFLEISGEHWDRMIAVNLRGMFLVAQSVSRHLVTAGHGGVILNMSSTNGIGGEADYAHYNAAKGGVLLLTRTMAVELGIHGIRVNALCPGYIDTPLNAGIAANLPEGFEDLYEREHIPLARRGRPEEVAAAYAFLASDDATFIHGTELVIDGGQLAIM